MSATNIRPAYGIGAADNNFECRKFSGGVLATETTHRTDPIPDSHWSGKYVGAMAVGGNCFFAITKNAAAEVDRTVAASNAGSTDKVAPPLLNGIPQFFRLPYWSVDSPAYFARESDALGTVVYMWLSDEPGIKKNP